jgi:hypothetical protein
VNAVHHIFRSLAAVSCSAILAAVSSLSAYADSSISQEGWNTSKDGTTFSYYYADGTYATGATVLPDGYPYLFTSDGTLKTGWQLIDGNRYYYSPQTGQIQIGWVSYMNKMYYVSAEDGKVTGAETIDGIPYIFDAFGALETGLVTYPDGSVHFVEEDTTPLTGFYTEDGDTYYFDETGTAITGTLVQDRTTYTFDETGVLIAKETDGIAYDVPYYAQADSRWGNVYIGSKTIAKVGCLTCCMAMLHSYYTGTEITPDVMCKQYLTYSDNSLLWAGVYSLGYEVLSASSSSATNLKTLYTRLQTGPVIVGATNSYGGMHYVVVTGCTKNDASNLTTKDFTINDPGYPDKTTLDQHFADYGNWYQFYCKSAS